MTLFRIIDQALTNNSNYGVSLQIGMKRKIMSEIMTTYFPSLLLMLITFATTFFKPFFFEAALSVNLTTMLVMTTIFISKMEGLPPTSDIKMIDYWLILCQLVPFVTVVLITAMEYLREDDDNIANYKGSHDIVNVSMYKGTTGHMAQQEEDKVQETAAKTRFSASSLKTFGKESKKPYFNYSIPQKRRCCPGLW